MKNVKLGRLGFTLIELLVVVLIIGILAAIALPQYQKAVTKSKLANLKTLVFSVANAAELYYLEKGEYPGSLEDLVISVPTPTNTISVTGGEYIFYSWGKCYLEKNNIVNSFACDNSQVGIGYGQMFLYSVSSPATKKCRAIPPSNQLSIQICQGETGKQNADYTDEHLKSFTY